jgi:BolA protein
MSNVRDVIESRLRAEFQPLLLEIIDESAKHAGHAGAAGGGGHFQVTIVSAEFEGKTILEQHRMVNRALEELIGGDIHALGLNTIAASHWDEAEAKDEDETA